MSNYAESLAPTIQEALELHGHIETRGFTFLERGGKETFYSFRKLREQAAERAAILRQLGVRKGDHVALVLPDGIDFVPAFFGVLWAGAIPVPLYPPLALGRLDAYLDGLTRTMTSSESAFLITTEQIRTIIGSAAAKVPTIKGIVSATELKGAAAPDADRSLSRGSPSDLCFLQFTSGSTSAPKGVEVTHDNLRANIWAAYFEGAHGKPETDVAVSSLPLYHDMGLIGFVIAPVLTSSSVVNIPTLAFVRQPSLWLETISKHKAHITFAPNFAYSLVTKRAKPEQIAQWDLSSVRMFGCGAEPINPNVMRAFVEKFRGAGLNPSAITPAYGMAEATLAMSFQANQGFIKTQLVDAETYEAAKMATTPLDNHRTAEFVACGKVFSNHDMAAFDDSGRRLPEGHIGEIWFKGPSVARGYYRNAEATEKTFGGGWLRTGDLGYLRDAEVYITGRKKDILIINGRNYDPQRLEWLADEVAGVRKGSPVAFTRPGPSSEELIVAVERRDGAAKEEIQSKIIEAISESTQLIPAEVVVVEAGALPKTSSGKLQRAKTREQYLNKTLGVEGVRTMGTTGDRISLARNVAKSFIGLGKLRAKRFMMHAQEVKSPADAVAKLKLVSAYARRLVGRVIH